MTAMPQLVSLFNAVGGGAAALVAIDDFIRLNSGAPVDTTIFVVLGALIGSVTFTGSLIAGGKLQGLIAGKPIYVPGGQIVTIALAIVAVAGTIALILGAAGAISPRSTVTLGLSPLSCWPAWSSASRWSCRSAARTCPSSSAC